jgi:hypothetical protein
MCCIPEIMRRTEPIEWEIFDPASFFRIQREMGLDPYVRGQSIGKNTIYEPRAECLACWARKTDPDGKRRAAYAAKKWDERQPGEIVVSLG